MSHKRLLAAFLLLVIAIWSVQSWALSPDREKLKGLKGVAVFVEPLRPELEHEGLSRRQIQEDVEAKLRKAGIRVLTGTQKPSFWEAPFIYVNLSVGKLETSYAYTIDLICLGASQVNPDKNNLLTWNVGSSGMIAHILEVREKVAELVDRFIRDFRSVNPA